jgi:hypothetical protein
MEPSIRRKVLIVVALMAAIAGIGAVALCLLVLPAYWE